jgi:hypothetical protein
VKIIIWQGFRFRKERREGKRRERREKGGKRRREKRRKKEGKNIQKGRQIMYTGVRENNNQKHERRRPKCGISNEETVNPHEESISNSPENQGADRPSRKKADIPRGSGNSGAGHADTTVREFPYGVYSAGKYG